MSLSLRLVAKTPLTSAALVAYFRARAGYKLESGGKVAYENVDTGVSFSFQIKANAVAMTLDVEGLRPPIFGLEAEHEASLLVEKFGFDITDPESKSDVPYSPDVVIRSYAQANAATHKKLLEDGSEHQELPSAVLVSAWRWNLQRDALERSLGNETIIPRVVTVVDPDTGRAGTAAVWPDQMPALVPHVDFLILANHGQPPAWVPVREVVQLLEGVGVRGPRFRYRIDGVLKEAGLRHYDASRDTELAAAILAHARTDGDPPAVIPTATVLSRELARMAMGLADGARDKKKPPTAPRFPRECQGFLRTKGYELTHVLGGYTWLSPFRIESIAVAEAASVVVGVGAGGIVFFDAESGRRVREVTGDAYAGTSVGISEDAKTLAVGDELGNVNVFDLDLSGIGPTVMKRFVYGIKDCAPDDESSPQGYVIGVSADGAVVLGSVGDWVFVLRDGEEPTVFKVQGAVCASRDLERIWTGTSVRDLASGEESFGIDSDPLAMRVPALSPDGQTLAFATAEGDLQVVRLADGVTIAAATKTDAAGQPSVARFIGYLPGADKLVIGDGNGLEVRSAITLEREKLWDTPVWDAALSTSTIYRAAGDRIWTQPLDGPAPPVNDGPVTQLFHSGRGPIAVTCCAPGVESMTGGRAILWHLPSGQVLRATDRLCPDRINLSPDGRLLYLATETALRVLDVGTLKEVAVVEPIGEERYVRPLDLDASPDGEHVLACLEGGLARMIPLKTSSDRWREQLDVRCATFATDGRLVVGDRSRLRVIDALTGEVQKEIAIDDPRDEGEHVLLGPGGRAVRVIPDEGIAVVDLDSETTTLQKIERPKETLAASPDGSLVALTVEGDTPYDELVLWAIDPGREVDRIQLHTAEDSPVSAAFSPDGSKLLVGTSRGAVLVFAKG